MIFWPSLQTAGAFWHTVNEIVGTHGSLRIAAGGIIVAHTIPTMTGCMCHRRRTGDLD